MMGLETIKSNLATCESQSLRPAVLHRRQASRRSSTELFLSSDANKLTFSEPAEGHCMGSVLWLFWGKKEEEGKKNRREPPFVLRHWIRLPSLNPAQRPLRAPLCSHKKTPTFMKLGEKASERRTALMDGWGNEKMLCLCFLRGERKKKYRKALKRCLGMMLLAIGALSRMLCWKETFTMRSIYRHGLLKFSYFACFVFLPLFNVKGPCISPMMDVYIECVFLVMPNRSVLCGPCLDYFFISHVVVINLLKGKIKMNHPKGNSRKDESLKA